MSADEAVPVCAVEMESVSADPDIFKKLSRLLPIALTTIEDDEPIDPDVIE